MSSGVWEQDSLEAFLFILALFGGTHAVRKVGTRGALETPLGLLARPSGRRQETKMADGSLASHHCRDFALGAGQAWLSCHMHVEGCTLPTSEGCCQSSFC